MKACNLDFFDYALNNIYHDTVELPEIDDDRISAGNSTVQLANSPLIPKSGILHFTGPINYFGRMTDVPEEGEVFTTVYFRPLDSLFDHDVLFKKSDQTSKTFEESIVNEIKKYHIDTKDTEQKLKNLSVKATTSTSDWTLNLNDSDETHVILNLYEDMISKALSKYGIAVNVNVDLQTKTLTAIVGKHENVITINADFPNVKIDTFKVHDFGNDVNKLEIWNANNFTDVKYYYLHTDGSYNETDADRVTPVHIQVSSVKPTDQKSFTTLAKESACSVFDGMEWEDDIKLEVYPDDTLIKPYELNIGQVVNIIHKGKSYGSILTGKNVGSTIMLVFGTVRDDLTKII